MNMFFLVVKKTPLLKFLLWSSANEVPSVPLAEAKSLYFLGEDWAKIIKPSEVEEKLMQALLYGVSQTKKH